MLLYYGALHLIIVLTYSFYKYCGALHLKKRAIEWGIFVENLCLVISAGAEHRNKKVVSFSAGPTILFWRIWMISSRVSLYSLPTYH